MPPKIDVKLLIELMQGDDWTSNAVEYVERVLNCHEQLLAIATRWHGSHPEGSIDVCATCQLIAKAEGRAA